jgi:hypothetical protein
LAGVESELEGHYWGCFGGTVEEFDGVLQFHYQLGCAIPWGHSMDQEVRYQHLWRSLDAEGGDEELGSSRQQESCDKALSDRVVG